MGSTANALGIGLLVFGIALMAFRGFDRQRAKNSRNVSASSFKGDATAAGRDLYNAGRDINVAAQPPTRDPLAAARVELQGNKNEILVAERDGRYAHSFFRIYRSWHLKAHEALDDLETRSKLDDAYSACELLYGRLNARGHRALGGNVIHVEQADELPHVVALIDEALDALD